MTTVTSQTDSTSGDLTLTNFLTALMDGIGVALGNANNFKVHYDDESNVVRIYDNQLVHIDNKAVDYPTLQVFGLDSVVRSMNFKTETSSKIGSQLAITAMAGKRNKVGGADTSHFSALNNKLTDRIMPIRDYSPNDTNTSATSNDTSQLVSLANLFSQHLINIYSLKKYNPADVGNVSNFYRETVATYKSNVNTDKDGVNTVTSDHVTARGILPLSVDITMDGISNFRLWEAFLLPYDRLPAQYKEGTKVKVGFVVTGVEHKIENQTWISNIRANMINVPSQETKASGALIREKQERKLEIGDTPELTGQLLEDAVKYVKGFEGLANAKPFNGTISYVRKPTRDTKVYAYKDSGGVWTIGWGSCYYDTAGKNQVKEGDVITVEDAEKLIRMEVAAKLKALQKKSKVQLTNGQTIAFLSLAYNCGDSGMTECEAWRGLQRGRTDYEALAKTIVSFKLHDKKGNLVKGLIRRRKEEAQMFLA
jgi:lysozyme